MNKYSKIKQIFEENRDNVNALPMSEYMQNNFKFYGIDAKRRKELEKDIIKEEKKNKKIDWEFLNKCYDDEYREMQYFVLDYLEAFSKVLVYEDILALEYFVKNKQWWDSIDKLDRIIGSINDSKTDELMLKWSTHKNFWYRRLAIDHQLGKKENTNKELLEKILLNNFGSNEFFINKAIGWSLREYSKFNQEWVRKFIKKNENKINKLSIREASKYL
jgi:3-methyladenine DNA glycosylase AlkD